MEINPRGVELGGWWSLTYSSKKALKESFPEEMHSCWCEGGKKPCYEMLTEAWAAGANALSPIITSHWSATNFMSFEEDPELQTREQAAWLTS